MEFLRMNVILTHFSTDNGDTGTEERKRNGGNHALPISIAYVYNAVINGL